LPSWDGRKTANDECRMTNDEGMIRMTNDEHTNLLTGRMLPHLSALASLRETSVTQGREGFFTPRREGAKESRSQVGGAAMRGIRTSSRTRDAFANARDGRAPRRVRRPSIADLFIAVMGNEHRGQTSEVRGQMGPQGAAR
jgi:hypothetical protein